jgi:hypothetical protein
VPVLLLAVQVPAVLGGERPDQLPGVLGLLTRAGVTGDRCSRSSAAPVSFNERPWPPRTGTRGKISCISFGAIAELWNRQREGEQPRAAVDVAADAAWRRDVVRRLGRGHAADGRP